MKKETELFPPIKKHFEKAGYKVNAEVIGHDIVLSKDNHIIIVEIKLHFNMKLLYQAIDAQKISNFVYVAIPQKKYKETAKIIHILKELGIGLITVASSKRLEIILAHDELLFTKPTNHRKTKRLKKEIETRKFDTNLGGSNRTKIITAYKEKVLQVACILLQLGASKPADLVKYHNCPPDTRMVMYNNIHGWFHRPAKGIYDLTPLGKEALKKVEYKEIVDFYLKK